MQKLSLCAQARKLMAQSLRYVAHLYGASLLYLGGLKGSSGLNQGSISQKDAASDRAAVANFRSMLSHMLFTGMDKRMYAIIMSLCCTACTAQLHSK